MRDGKVVLIPVMVLLGLLAVTKLFWAIAPISVNSVVGTYGCWYPFGTDKITLRADGSFQQKFTSASGVATTRTDDVSIDLK